MPESLSSKFHSYPRGVDSRQTVHSPNNLSASGIILQYTIHLGFNYQISLRCNVGICVLHCTKKPLLLFVRCIHRRRLKIHSFANLKWTLNACKVDTFSAQRSFYFDYFFRFPWEFCVPHRDVSNNHLEKLPLQLFSNTRNLTELYV